ncbi:hypothetical protein OG298_45470 (plasmid) [Streptomyces sp. NBC_01005]|uniref:hypothetical protein n=1 Tax=Streptomyces sp. NBC_01005 TaxID=2903715 RepID=UPI002F917422|nr:hypothetical protein OG298_45470 [Streptomyces sp. NBC_01005]
MGAFFDRDEINRGLADPASIGYPEPAPWQREVRALHRWSPEPPTDTGQGVDHPEDELHEEPSAPEPTTEAVKALTTDSPPTVSEAITEVQAALDQVDTARARLGAALRAEQQKTGASANELAARVHGTMSRPLVLKALR